ncbi:MAG: HRDC domain-containing protein, partial [Defluviitaleaceae bacterium]|nr:HRDC domain-containing protein [Defluviitaleaceae bacterium]
TLVDMCARMPSNEDEFLSVSGVGQVKLAKYGAAFLEAMREFSNKQRAYENAAADPAKPADYAGTAPYDLARFVEENYEFSGDPVSVSVFMDKINALVYQKRGKGLAVRKVTGRLIEDGYLEDKETDGIKARVATGKGKLAGISTVLEENAGGAAYYRNYYNAAAQRIMLGYAADSLRAEGEKR